MNDIKSDLASQEREVKEDIKIDLEKDLGRSATNEEVELIYNEMRRMFRNNADELARQQEKPSISESVYTYNWCRCDRSTSTKQGNWIGDNFQVDEYGNLLNYTDWSPEYVKIIAGKDNCDLTSDHWEVINFLREYYVINQLPPPVRVLYKAMGKKLDRKVDISEYIDQLFPNGPAVQACRYAGYPTYRGLQ